MANKPVKLRILDTLGSPVWVSTEDGQKVFDKISEAFNAGHAVDLSFANGGTMIAAFLNAAIGQLYSGEYQEDFVQENLTFLTLILTTRQCWTGLSLMQRSILLTEQNTIRHGKRILMQPKNKAHNATAYQFQEGEEILVDANVWLYLFPPPAQPEPSQCRP